MQALQIINLSKSFDSKSIPAFKNLNFRLMKGKILSIFGPSGTGKSTLLKIIAGGLRADSGEIKQVGAASLVDAISDIDGSLSMSEVMGEKILHLSKEEQIQRKRELVDLFSLFYKDQQPFKSLSLGEQKRVLLARALAPRPSVLLLDEPFSSLDLILKNEIKFELKEIFKLENVACLFVSHNFEDIMNFSDQVAILDVGEIRQIDTPKMVYDFPKDAHVARLIQNACLIAGEILHFRPDNILIKTEWGEFQLNRFHADITEVTKRVNLLIYPHEFELREKGISAEVLLVSSLGPVKEVTFKIKDRTVLAHFSNSAMIKKGENLALGIKTKEVRLIPL